MRVRTVLRGLVAAMPAALVVSVAGAIEVVELGPTPIAPASDTGRVSAVVCSPTDPNRIYVAGADGGVWRTLDGGLTWSPLTDHMPTTAMGALALDPTDEDVIYAGTGEANFANHSRYGLGLFKSTDGGDSWVHLAESTFAGRCFAKILVHPSSPQTVWAAVTPAGGFPALAAAKGHPQRGDAVGVFRSVDGGVTWTALTNGLPALAATDLAIDPTNPDVVYAAIGHIFGSPDNGIYKSTDGGDGWTRLGGGLPTTTMGRISLAVAPSNGQRLYALVTRPSNASGGGASMLGAFRSDTGGATWTALTSLSNIQATYGWYLSVVSVQPTNPDVVFMGGLDLVRSTNAGTSFSFVTPIHVDQHAIAWDAAGRLVVGDDGGVHRSTNLGTNWIAINAGLATVQFYAGLSTHPTDPLILLGGLQDNGSCRRTTNTRQWTQVFGGDGGWTQLDPATPTRVFVEFQGTGNLYRSTNGGTSFNLVNTGIVTGDRNCFLPPYLIDPTNSSRMLYATQRVYRSLDGGTSWSPISGDQTTGSGAIRTMAMAPTNPNVVWIATNDGNVRVSTDGGATFAAVLSGVPGWPRVTREIFVDPTDANTMYLATAHFGTTQIRRTRDLGQTFEPLDAALPDVPVNVVAADVRFGQPVVYAGTDAGLLRSIDDGASWNRMAGIPNACVIDLRLEPSRNRLIVATQGRGAWAVIGLIPGDLDNDGDVDVDDLALLLSDFGCEAACTADVDGDGDVDLNDLTALLGQFGFAA